MHHFIIVICYQTICCQSFETLILDGGRWAVALDFGPLAFVYAVLPGIKKQTPLEN
jgi:hypothetical protein